MALTERQKNIINPYPQEIAGAKSLEWYSDLNNKFVMDAIHESFVYFLTFPDIGTTLRGKDRQITEEDYGAYFALYPQNGKVLNNQVVTLSFDASKEQLRRIVNNLRTNEVLDKYTSNTTELSRLPEYADNLDVAKLIAIPQNHSLQYRKQLRNSLNLVDPIVSNSEDTGQVLDFVPEVSVYIGSDSNVDLYDWRENCLPGQQQSRVYYNSADKNYYFTRRTDSFSYQDYALAMPRPEPSFFDQLGERAEQAFGAEEEEEPSEETRARAQQEQQQQRLTDEERRQQLTQNWNEIENVGAGSAKQNYQDAYDLGVKEILKLIHTKKL